MNKLDVYSNLNRRLITGNLLVMFMGDMIFAFNVLYWDTSNLIFTAAVYLVIALMVIISLYNALKKICRESVFGSEAALYQSLPIDKRTFVVGKIFVAGLCFFMAFLPILMLTPLTLEMYGLAYSPESFLILRGHLPDEIWIYESLVFLTEYIFMYVLGAISLAGSLYVRGVKKKGNIAVFIITAGAAMLAAAVVSLPWIVKIVSPDAAVTVGTPVISLLIAIGVLSGAAIGACKVVERGVGFEEPERR